MVLGILVQLSNATQTNYDECDVQWLGRFRLKWYPWKNVTGTDH